MNKVEKNYGIGLSEFTQVFRIFEGLLGCHKEQPDENLPVIYEMIAESFPERGLAIFATAMQMYCGSKLSIKPKPGEYMPPLSFATISACIAEMNAVISEKERNEKTSQDVSFSVSFEERQMDTETAQKYLNDLLKNYAFVEYNNPIWFLYAEAFRIAYKSGVIFDYITRERCEAISIEVQLREFEQVRWEAKANPALYDVVRIWNNELTNGNFNGGMKKMCRFKIIQQIISEMNIC